jgi:hypothetical protein
MDTAFVEMYFVGNVLSPTETQPEQHDPTFAFTREEAQMDLKGIPIHMEHDEKMKVGTIQKSWNQEDGSSWIVGKIDDPSMFGAFARNAIQKSSRGRRYYTGLSLTHTHTQYANGKTEKAPVEVSLCVDPRRSDCRIMFVDDMDETRINTYKASDKILKMADEQPKVEPVETPKEETPEPTETEPSKEKLMEIIVEQRKREEELEKQAEELQKLKAQMEEQKKREFEQAAAKNEAMAKALMESWSNTLDQNDFNDESRANILEMAKKFPHESKEFFRVAHNASKKSLQREKELKEAAEALKNAGLKKDFDAVMNKTTHVASKKKVPEEKTDKSYFMDALNKYRVTGSGRNLMEQVAEIGNRNKRRKMF